jgi:predicted helicase
MKNETKQSKIYYAHLWGLRERKYDWLSKNDLKTTKWKKIVPDSPYYFFVQREEKGREIYEKFWKITDIFPVNCVGIVTARDKFVIDFDKDVLKRRIEMFRNLSMPDELIKQSFKLKDTSTFKLRKSRETLSKDENWDRYFAKILYRPFDKRNIYYTNIIVERPLLEVMRHMMHENLGLLFARPQSPKYEFSVFASETIIDQCVVGNKSAGAGISYIAPLYLYHEKGNSKSRTSGSIMMLLEPQVDYIVKKPNLSPVIVEQLTKDFKKTPSHEQIFFYIYAVLYSKIYRTKYAEFLKIDFPRVPFTKDYKLFSKMAEYGKRLVDLLLLKPTALDPLVTKFQGKGENKVEKVRYEQSKIFINKEKYFEGVAPQVWEYQIGGYQVCDKWLKDRKGRKLSLDDIKHYCKIVSSLQKTIEIQKAIDKIYSEIEKETIEFTTNEGR